MAASTTTRARGREKARKRYKRAALRRNLRRNPVPKFPSATQAKQWWSETLQAMGYVIHRVDRSTPALGAQFWIGDAMMVSRTFDVSTSGQIRIQPNGAWQAISSFEQLVAWLGHPDDYRDTAPRIAVIASVRRNPRLMAQISGFGELLQVSDGHGDSVQIRVWYVDGRTGYVDTKGRPVEHRISAWAGWLRRALALFQHATPRALYEQLRAPLHLPSTVSGSPTTAPSFDDSELPYVRFLGRFMADRLPAIVPIFYTASAPVGPQLAVLTGGWRDVPGRGVLCPHCDETVPTGPRGHECPSTFRPRITVRVALQFDIDDYPEPLTASNAHTVARIGELFVDGKLAAAIQAITRVHKANP